MHTSDPMHTCDTIRSAFEYFGKLHNNLLVNKADLYKVDTYS